MPRSVKVERLSRLIELSKEISFERNREWIGREVEVLVNGPAAEADFVQGHTRGNHVALVKGPLAPGIHRVYVASATPNRLYCVTEPTGVSAELSRSQLPADICELSFAV
jgi:tRNA-2-methylthio-N6-dimethylallyladenosine synthase